MLLTHVTAAEYFKERLEWALSNQHVATEETTNIYLVNLLCRFLDPEKSGIDSRESLGIRFLKAANRNPGDRRHLMRSVADTSLFLTGCFPESFSGRLVSSDYFAALGASAYRTLASDALFDDSGSLFLELGERFREFGEVIGEAVGQEPGELSQQEIYRLCRLFLKTGSQRANRALRKQGIDMRIFYRA